ncbi:MAG: S-methyl-5'-thioadenosine phosphorylase [Spirochaetes bacterium]|nr:S-methyl-5'-thioadenosine phosphorylase [Spirochaetota bacterium]
MTTRIAVIGGSGLYEIDGVKFLDHVEIATPFGRPSDRISIAEIGGERVAFLPRHGRGHRFLPSEVPSRANIWALKSLGVVQVISVSAVGSLSEECAPGSFVLPDQLIDRTTGRPSSFFGDGVVGHVSFAEPFCPGMRERIAVELSRAGHAFRDRATLVCMEGPAFSSRAESLLHRSWGAHLIGMTALPEAKLAREAEMCYATVAMVTDWDCWRGEGGGVTLEMVLATMRQNVQDIKRALPGLVGALADRADCTCRHAAALAIVTDPSLIPPETKQRLNLLYGRYWAGPA